MNSLSKITDTELEGRLKDLVAKERKLLHVILDHIKEVDTRKLYLARAYSSLYEYLVKELGYSGSAAMRRLEAARLLKEVPSISEKIQEGSLNLSQIGELSKIIKEKERTTGAKISCIQKTELVSMIVGKTTFETQKEVSLALDIPVKDRESQSAQKDESVRVEMTFSKAQYEKLLRCKDLAAHLVHKDNKDSTLSSLIEVLADQYLQSKQKSSCSKKSKVSDDSTSERPPLSSSSSFSSSAAALPDDKSKNTVETKNEISIIFSGALPNNQNQYLSQTKIESENENKAKAKIKNTTELVISRVNKGVTPKTRRGILARDLCCQFKDSKSGKQCKSTYGLQVDHKHSRWAGGDNSSSNLQAYCFHHNQYKYKKETNIRTLNYQLEKKLVSERKFKC